MRKKLGDFERHLEREKKLPGPGYYQQDDLVGTGLSTSTMRNTSKHAFPKSENRFTMNKFTIATPPPNNYHVKNSLNENFSSTHGFAGQTVFGSNKKTFID